MKQLNQEILISAEGFRNLLIQHLFPKESNDLIRLIKAFTDEETDNLEYKRYTRGDESLLKILRARIMFEDWINRKKITIYITHKYPPQMGEEITLDFFYSKSYHLSFYPSYNKKYHEQNEYIFFNKAEIDLLINSIDLDKLPESLTNVILLALHKEPDKDLKAGNIPVIFGKLNKNTTYDGPSTTTIVKIVNNKI